MPYLHWDYDENVNQDPSFYDSECIPSTTCLHPRRTLDAAGYPFLPTDSLKKRNSDQVLARYQRSLNKVRLEQPKVMIVDQLWFWNLDERKYMSPNLNPNAQLGSSRLSDCVHRYACDLLSQFERAVPRG